MVLTVGGCNTNTNKKVCCVSFVWRFWRGLHNTGIIPHKANWRTLKSKRQAKLARLEVTKGAPGGYIPGRSFLEGSQLENRTFAFPGDSPTFPRNSGQIHTIFQVIPNGSQSFPDWESLGKITFDETTLAAKSGVSTLQPQKESPSPPVDTAEIAFKVVGNSHTFPTFPTDSGFSRLE